MSSGVSCADDDAHHLIFARAGLIVIERSDKIDRVLTGKVGRLRQFRHAVHAVTGLALPGFLLARFGISGSSGGQRRCRKKHRRRVGELCASSETQDF